MTVRGKTQQQTLPAPMRADSPGLQPSSASSAAILLTASALLATACAGWSSPRCADTAQLSNDLTPVELSLEAGECARRGQLRGASLRYGLAMAFSTYDNERAGSVDPPGWKSTRMMLPQMILRSRLEPPGLAALLEDFKAATEPGERHSEFCALLQRVGPPIYPVNYAVNERMEVVRPDPTSREAIAARSAEKRPGFDAQAAWRTVRTKVVECPPG